LLRLAASDNAGGFGVSEVIGAGMRMMAAGLSMGQIQSVGGKFPGLAREQVGAKAVDATVIAFPGLSQFM
jgi:hypothetical protein